MISSNSAWRDRLLSLLSLVTLLLAFSASRSLAQESSASPHEVLVVVGAPGEESYLNGFRDAAQDWEEACRSAGIDCAIVGISQLENATPTRDKIESWLTRLDPNSDSPAWIVYIGHGTYARRAAYLNLVGPDLEAATLAEWLKPLSRTFVFVHGGSASGPFLSKISAPNRITITATQTGDELNYARFGESIARVIANGEGDLNQDGQVSILEAFLSASSYVANYYVETGRIATEGAMIDDNGDGLGTPFDWFSGDRVTKKSDDGLIPDGFRSGQIALVESDQEKQLSPTQKRARNQLEQELERLRSKKTNTPEVQYYQALEDILNRISDIYLSEDS